jgi:uncharacterized membrane protein
VTPALLALAVVGVYVAAQMHRKAIRGRRGLLVEPSVVQTARARVLAGVPNSAIGLVYYVCIGVAAFFQEIPLFHDASVVAASLAAVMSLYLAYSLLFVTKMPCAMCWTGHVVNWALLAVLLFWH